MGICGFSKLKEAHKSRGNKIKNSSPTLNCFCRNEGKINKEYTIMNEKIYTNAFCEVRKGVHLKSG